MSIFETLYAAPPALVAHAAVLLVVGPLIAASAAALSPNSRWAWMIATAGSIFALWMALCLAGEVARSGPQNYFLGGFAPPLGIAFRIDALGVMFALLISGIAVAVSLFSGHSLDAEVRAGKHALFQAGFLLCLTGLLGMAATGDAFNAFVFLEISSIGTYALIAVGERTDRRALPAAFHYLVMGTVGATFFVVGVGFLYAVTGTLNMADMAARIATLGDNRATLAGFAFIAVGLGLKAAIFPLHGWLPAAYAHAPSMITAFLAAVGTKAAIYLLIRFTFTVFDPGQAQVEALLAYAIAPVAALAVLVGSAQAIFQAEVRRMLAWSSVAQIGLIMLGIAIGTWSGLAAGLFQLTAHALAKAVLFTALGGIAIRGRQAKLSDFAGAGRQAPWTMTAFGVGCFSLIGVPFTAGFLGKWKLVEAGLGANWIWMVAIVALGSMLTLIYCGRLIEVLFFRTPGAGAMKAVEAPLGVQVPLWLLAGGTIWFGVDAAIPEGLADAAARAVSP